MEASLLGAVVVTFGSWTEHPVCLVNLGAWKSAPVKSASSNLPPLKGSLGLDMACLFSGHRYDGPRLWRELLRNLFSACSWLLALGLLRKVPCGSSGTELESMSMPALTYQALKVTFW